MYLQSLALMTGTEEANQRISLIEGSCRKKGDVSAAHCFCEKNRVMDASLFRVDVGTVRLSWSEEDQGAQTVVKEILLNLRYATNTQTQTHDIAVVLLDQPATVNVACNDWTNEYDTMQLPGGQQRNCNRLGLAVQRRQH